MASSTAERQVTITLQSVWDKEPILDRKFMLTDSNRSIKIGRSSSKESSLERQPATDNAYFKSAIISREHAEIYITLDSLEVFLRDTDSLHGTTANGIVVEPGTAVALEHKSIVTVGDKITFGNKRELTASFEIDWKWEEPDKRPVMPLISPPVGSQPPGVGVNRTFTPPGLPKGLELPSASGKLHGATTPKPRQTFRVPESESEGSDSGEPLYIDEIEIDDDDLLFVKAVSRNFKTEPSRSQAIQKEGVSNHHQHHHRQHGYDRKTCKHVLNTRAGTIPGSSPSNPVTIEEASASVRLSRAPSTDIQPCSPESPTFKPDRLKVDLATTGTVQSLEASLRKQASSPPVSIASNSAPSSPGTRLVQHLPSAPWIRIIRDSPYPTLQALKAQEAGKGIEQPQPSVTKENLEQLSCQTDIRGPSLSQVSKDKTAIERSCKGNDLAGRTLETAPSSASQNEPDRTPPSESSIEASSDLASEECASSEGDAGLRESEENDDECISNSVWDDYCGISMVSGSVSSIEAETSSHHDRTVKEHVQKERAEKDCLSEVSHVADKSGITKEEVKSLQKVLSAHEDSRGLAEDKMKATSGVPCQSDEAVKKPNSAAAVTGNVLNSHRRMQNISNNQDAWLNSFAETTNVNGQKLPKCPSHHLQSVDHGGINDFPKYNEPDQLRDNGASSTTAYLPWISRSQGSHLNSKNWHMGQAVTGPSNSIRPLNPGLGFAEEGFRHLCNPGWSQNDFAQQDANNEALSAFLGHPDSYLYPMGNHINGMSSTLPTEGSWWSAPSSYMVPYSSRASRNEQNAFLNPFAQTGVSNSTFGQQPLGSSANQLSEHAIGKERKGASTSVAQAPITKASNALSHLKSLPTLAQAGSTLKEYSNASRKRKAEQMSAARASDESNVGTSEKKKDTRVPVSHLLREQSSLPSPPSSEESTANATQPNVASVSVASESDVSDEVDLALHTIPTTPALTASSPSVICIEPQTDSALEGSKLVMEVREPLDSSRKGHKRVLSEEDEKVEENPRPVKKSRLSMSKSSALPFIMGTVVGGIGMIGALISLPDSLF